MTLSLKFSRMVTYFYATVKWNKDIGYQQFVLCGTTVKNVNELKESNVAQYDLFQRTEHIVSKVVISLNLYS